MDINNDYMVTENLSVSDIAKLLNEFVAKYHDNKSYQRIFDYYNLAFPLAFLIQRGEVQVCNYDGAMVIGACWDYICNNVFHCDPDLYYSSIDDMVVGNLV